MTYKTRKRIWPMSLAAVVGVFATLAVLTVAVWTPGTAQAQAPFAAPANLVATATSTSEINLSWDAGLGQTSYEVERQDDGDPGWTSLSRSITGTTYSDTGLTADTQYTYRVRGVNNFGESSWSNEATETTEGRTQLDPPANLEVDSTSVTSLAISWDAVDGASGYRVEYQGPDDNAYRVHSTVNATNVTIANLDPGTRYMIRVTALGVSGTSEDSEPAMLEANTAQVAYNLTVNEAASVELTTPGEHQISAEVETDSPADQTTVAVRISQSDGTMHFEADPGIDFTESGLRAVGPQSIDDGNLVIDIRDAATRVFTLNVTCTADNADELRGTLDIEIRDDRQVKVAEATVSCVPPLVPPAPEERASACYAITGMPDRIGDDDRTADTVEFSDVELYTTDKSVQLRVTSYEHWYSASTVNNVTTITEYDCPHWPQPSVFIRLVDTPGVLPDMPIVDDEGGFVDENGLIDNHGAVVGVSSGGELLLDIEATRGVQLTATETRMTGVREATFVVFTPDDVEVNDQYFVELYDYRETQRIKHLHRDPNRVRLYDRTRVGVGYYDGLTEVEQEYERVVYVASPDVLPTKLAVTTYSDRPGVALLSWTPVSDAERHHAIVVHNGAAVSGSYAVVTQVGADGRMSTTVTGLEENKEYIFAVVAENTDNDGQPQYSELAMLSQEMDWASGS